MKTVAAAAEEIAYAGELAAHPVEALGELAEFVTEAVVQRRLVQQVALLAGERHQRTGQGHAGSETDQSG